jgi:serine/threonine protein kinase
MRALLVCEPMSIFNEKITIEGVTVRVVKQIGEGGFAIVYQAKDSSSSRLYALKKSFCQEQEQLDEVLRELKVLKLVKRNHRFVQLVASEVRRHEHPTTAFILMEFCTRGTLRDYLADTRHRSPQENAEIFFEICMAVAELHALGITHRDIKMENVLIDEIGRYKLADFGSSTTTKSFTPKTGKESSNAEDDIAKHTTLMYRAPEQIELFSKLPLGPKVDVWALGCLFYFMLCDQHAFGDT